MLTTIIIPQNPGLPLIMAIIEYLLLVQVNQIYLFPNLQLYRTIIHPNRHPPIKYLILLHQIIITIIIKILHNHLYLYLPHQVIWFRDPPRLKMGAKNRKNRKNLIHSILQIKIIIIRLLQNLIFTIIIMAIIIRRIHNLRLLHQILGRLQDR